ncbi:MAG: PAS domain S-box protein [Methanobacteriota archaeon]
MRHLKNRANSPYRLLIGVLLFFLIFGMLALWVIPVASGETRVFEENKSFTPDTDQDDVIKLTMQEQTYLAQLGTVTMCVDPDWEPYEFITENGDYEGIAADLVRLIAHRSGVTLQLVPTKDWDESINASQEGKCQILPFLTQTPARDEWLVFTEPYFSDPNVLITRTEHDFIADPSGLSDQSIALPSGTSVEERIRKDYPQLTIINAGSSEADAFSMVEERKADMTLRSLTMAAYTIRKEGLFNLKIAGQIPDYSNNFRIGVVKNQSPLRDILNKGIATITPQEVQQIVNRHISIDVLTGIDYDLIFKIIAGFSIIVVFALLYVYQLRKINTELAKREEELITVSAQLQNDLTERIRLEDQIQKANSELKTQDEELRTQLAIVARNEQALRDSEEKYRLLIENSIEGISVVQDNVLKFFNPMTPVLLGYTPEELDSTPFIRFIHPDDQNRVMTNHQNRLKGIPVENRYQYRIIRKDESVRWVEMNSVFIRWEEKPAVLSFITDITSRIVAEEALRESEEKYRYMAENSSDVIWHLDSSYCFTYISPADERMRGFSQQEVLGTTVWSLLKPEGIEHVREVNASRLTREQEGFSSGTIRYELEQICKDGRWIWTEVNVTAHHDKEGTIIGYHGVTRDISERKEAELALKENEEKFFSIFEETPDPILILNSRDQIIEVNQGFERIFGDINKNISGKTLHDAGLYQNLSEIKDDCIKTPDCGIHRREMTFQNRNGAPFIAEIAISRIYIRTEPCFLIQIHDIDEIRRAHDAVAQVNHKLKILSSITRHDILNRIMVTSFYNEEVRNKVTDEKMRKQLDAVSQATGEIRTLIEFTGQYQDLGATAPTWQNISTILKYQVIQGLVKGITLTSHLGDIEIYADRMLEKVLYNLVENSVRHGQNLTSIRLTSDEEGGEMVIWYEDNGGGIADDEKEKVFEKGFGKNTGLGLFLIREILSITGISIIESGKPGVGVRFEILVPPGKWRKTE